MLRRNVGGIDRVLRVTLGGILFLGGLALLIGTIRLGVVLVAVGLLALLTGIVRFCVLYIPFGISTIRPGGQPLDQICDCAAWMKAKQDARPAANPPASTEEEVGQVHGSRNTVDFGRVEFLEIVHVERPRIIYTNQRKHFFFLAGLAVCTTECSDVDFESEHILLPWLSQSAN